MTLPNVAKRYVDAVFAKDDGVSEERKQMFLKLYGMGLSQEKAREMILGSILMEKRKQPRKRTRRFSV